MFTHIRKKTYQTVSLAIGAPSALLIILFMFSSTVQAQYDYELIIYPGAVTTSAFGVTDKGDVVGNANFTFVSEDSFGYTLDSKDKVFTDVTSLDAVLGVNKSGVLVGDLVDGSGFSACAMRDKKGVVTTFYPPSWAGIVDPAVDFCQARAVSHSGKVTGFVRTNLGADWTGFVHDPKKGTFEEFLSSPNTIAQGINKKGQIVGNVALGANEAYPGSPSGRYGFLREKNGDVKHFTVNSKTTTRGRGLTDKGDIAGWYLDNYWWGAVAKSFKVKLSGGPGFENIDVPEAELIMPDSCNVVAPAPLANWTRFTDVFLQAIQKHGVVVGQCQDFDILFDPPGDPNGNFVDFIGYDAHGFIATPQCGKSGKRGKSGKSKKSKKC